MNSRERVNRAIHFQGPDRPPISHAILPSAQYHYKEKLAAITDAVHEDFGWSLLPDLPPEKLPAVYKFGYNRDDFGTLWHVTEEGRCGIPVEFPIAENYQNYNDYKWPVFSAGVPKYRLYSGHMAGTSPDYYARGFDLVEHGGVNGLEEGAPFYRGDHEVVLGAPVVGEVDALVGEGEPAVEPVEVELEQVVAELVELFAVLGEVHHGRVEAVELLHLFEEGDPAAAGVVVGAGSGHVAAVEAVLGDAGGEDGPLVGAVVVPVFSDGVADGDAASAAFGDLPDGAELVGIDARLVHGRELLFGQVGEQVPAEVFMNLVGDGFERIAELVLHRGQDAVRDGRAVRPLEVDGARNSFSTLHFRDILLPGGPLRTARTKRSKLPRLHLPRSRRCQEKSIPEAKDRPSPLACEPEATSRDW